MEKEDLLSFGRSGGKVWEDIARGRRRRGSSSFTILLLLFLLRWRRLIPSLGLRCFPPDIDGE